LSIPTHPCRLRNRERKQHYALVERKPSDSEQKSRDARKSSRDVRGKRLLQERANSGKAEHNMGRIEACSIKIATNRTGDLVRHKENRGMDKMEEDGTVVCFVKLESRKDKTRT
jgi:hypothetical protein